MNGVVEKCTNIGCINASSYGGGIVSLSATGTIRNCINTGNININGQESNDGAAGGILGTNRGICSIYNCINSGKVNAS
mgnify:CR=1 FL=1